MTREINSLLFSRYRNSLCKHTEKFKSDFLLNTVFKVIYCLYFHCSIRRSFFRALAVPLSSILISVFTLYFSFFIICFKIYNKSIFEPPLVALRTRRASITRHLLSPLPSRRIHQTPFVRDFLLWLLRFSLGRNPISAIADALVSVKFLLPDDITARFRDRVVRWIFIVEFSQYRADNIGSRNAFYRDRFEVSQSIEIEISELKVLFD